jgi:hypothetical protein
MSLGSIRSSRALAALWIALLLLTSLPAQTPTQQAKAPQASKQSSPADGKQGGFKFKVATEVVLVNVVARDNKGNLVTDLKMNDFTLLEDGKPQHLESFDFENHPSPPTPVLHRKH